MRGRNQMVPMSKPIRSAKRARRPEGISCDHLKKEIVIEVSFWKTKIPTRQSISMILTRLIVERIVENEVLHSHCTQNAEIETVVRSLRTKETQMTTVSSEGDICDHEST